MLNLTKSKNRHVFDLLLLHFSTSSKNTSKNWVPNLSMPSLFSSDRWSRFHYCYFINLEYIWWFGRSTCLLLEYTVVFTYPISCSNLCVSSDLAKYHGCFQSVKCSLNWSKCVIRSNIVMICCKFPCLHTGLIIGH